MNSPVTLPGGAPLRARSKGKAFSPIYAIVGGEKVARVPLQRGGSAIFSARLWEDSNSLGYKAQPRLIGNGTGSTYVASSYTSDSPKRGHTCTVAAVIVAIKAEQEGLQLPRRWKVHYLNGNHFDLRAGNLQAVPAGLGRSAARILADVRKRRKLIANGLDPNAVFAERRRRKVEKMRTVNEVTAGLTALDISSQNSRETINARACLTSPRSPRQTNGSVSRSGGEL